MITPNKIAKESESSQQCAFFAYCAVAYNHGLEVADEWCDTGRINQAKSKPLKALKWIHHVPNGGARGSNAKERMIRGARLKAEGVKPGVADVFLPHGVFCYGRWWHGLYIEMKKPALRPKRSGSKGGMEPEQLEFKEYCQESDFAFATCYDWKEAVVTLKQYINSHDEIMLTKIAKHLQSLVL